jgi:hypothetical protein
MASKNSPWYYVVLADSTAFGRDDLYGTIEDGKAMFTFTPDRAERFTTRKKAERFMRCALYMFSNRKRVVEMYDHNL